MSEKTSSIEISVITPMHNEQECVREFYKRANNVLKEMRLSYEIIIVSDGSTDKTNSILNELANSDSHLLAILLARNVGQCYALKAGLKHSRGKYVIVMDGDLQHLPEEIPLLVNEIKKGYDIVSGYRSKRKEPFFSRRFPSLIANLLLRLTTGCHIHDMGGFKCLKGNLARSLNLRAGQHRFIPVLVYLRGGTISEVPISAPPRFAGKSHYGIWRALDVLMDICILWFQSSFRSRPLYGLGRLSLITLFASLAIFLWLLYEKIEYGFPMAIRPPFFAMLLLLVASMLFLIMSFILEILSTLIVIVSDEKPYQIQSIIRDSSSAESTESDPKNQNGNNNSVHEPQT